MSNSHQQLQFTQRLINTNLLQNQSQLEQITQKLEEYDRLQDNLLELAKHSKKEVMVPISEVGFFRGQIKHSNEVLVFLGDNYFVERTAHECQPIIERRKDLLKGQIKALDQEVEREEKLQDVLKEQQLADTETRWTKEGVLDIREDYEDDNKLIDHSANIPSKDLDEEDDFEVQFQKLKLKALTNPQPQPKLQQQQQPQQIRSPADIRQYMEQVTHQQQLEEQKQPKSILKKSAQVQQQEQDAEPMIQSVIERNPQQHLQQPKEEVEEQPKRVSKFKQQRMNQ